MPRYRRKPLEVDAVQFTRTVEVPGVRVVQATDYSPSFGIVDATGALAYWGDWLITLPDGRLAVVRPWDFNCDYEPVGKR